MEDDLRQLIHQLDPATYTRAADLLSDRNWHLTAENLAQAIVELREADQEGTAMSELPDREARERDLTVSLHRSREALHPDSSISSGRDVEDLDPEIHPTGVDLEEYEQQRDEEIATDAHSDLAGYNKADAETRRRFWPGLTRADLQERAAHADKTLQRRHEAGRLSDPAWVYGLEGKRSPRLGPEGRGIRRRLEGHHAAQKYNQQEKPNTQKRSEDLAECDAEGEDTRTFSWSPEELAEVAAAGHETLRQLEGWPERLETWYEACSARWAREITEPPVDYQEWSNQELESVVRETVGDLVWYAASDEDTRAFFWPGLTYAALESRLDAATQALQGRQDTNAAADFADAALDRARALLDTRNTHTVHSSGSTMPTRTASSPDHTDVF